MNHRLTTILAALLCAGTAACNRGDKAEGAPDAKAANANDAKAIEAGDAKAGEAGDAQAAGGATCVTAAENLIKLIKPELEQQLAQIPEEQRADAQQQMAANLNVEAITAQCKEQAPDQKELECVTNAKTTQELQGCQGPPPGGAPPPGHGPAGPPPGHAPPQPSPAAPAPGGEDASP
jgi:hypothetical protein